MLARPVSDVAIKLGELEMGETGTPEILFKEESYQIMGACFEVYKRMGSGFLESVCQECLCIEFKANSIAFEQQPRLQLTYREQILAQNYMPDFYCFGKIILEIKAVWKLADDHRAQLRNYLKATKARLGLLVNFGHSPRVEWERVIM